MAETKARFLADTQKADTTAEAFTMPSGRATQDNYVLAMTDPSSGTLYIAGGGAGAYGNSPGGTGGGGQSYTTTTTGQVGMANTGSGAGGANTYGGAGGSGIVIIRYAI